MNLTWQACIMISVYWSKFGYSQSQVDANMKCWQIYGNLNFCDYIYISVVWGNL